MENDYDDEPTKTSPLTLTETTEGMFMAGNIYNGAEDFFSVDPSAAYEFDDRRSDSYPLDRAYQIKFR